MQLGYCIIELWYLVAEIRDIRIHNNLSFHIGMSSHFFIHQMKALNEDFRMASFSSLALTVLEICAFKVQKTSHFFRKISPLWNFKKWGQNLWFLSFQNWFLSSCFAISPKPLGQNSSLIPFWKANLNTDVEIMKTENSREIRGLGPSFPKWP